MLFVFLRRCLTVSLIMGLLFFTVPIEPAAAGFCPRMDCSLGEVSLCSSDLVRAPGDVTSAIRTNILALDRAVSDEKTADATEAASQFRINYCLLENGKVGEVTRNIDAKLVENLIKLAALQRQSIPDAMSSLRTSAILTAKLPPEDRSRLQYRSLLALASLQFEQRDPGARETFSEALEGVELNRVAYDTELLNFASTAKPDERRTFLLDQLRDRMDNGRLRQASIIAALLARQPRTQDNKENFDLTSSILAMEVPHFGSADDATAVCVASAQGNDEKRALLVGVSGNTLIGTANDIQLMQQALLARGVRGDNIVVISEPVISRTDLIRAMAATVTKSACGDTVFLHFTGAAGLLSAVTGINDQLITVPGWRSMMFLGDLRNATPATIKSAEVLRGIDLAAMVIALRNRGASVVLAIDASSAAGVGVLQLQQRMEAGVWTGRLTSKGGLVKPMAGTIEGLPQLRRDAAGYTGFFAADADQQAFEQYFEGGKFGAFSYAFAKTLQAQSQISARSLVEAVAKEFEGIKRERHDISSSPVFESSNPEMVVFGSSAPAASAVLDLEILSPAAMRAATALEVHTPEFVLIGRLADRRAVAILTVSTQQEVRQVPIDDDGQFSARVKLGPGHNTVTVAAIGPDFRFRTKTLEFTYEGDLERFTAAGARYALVIGIDNYDNMTKLATPLNDAREVASVLHNMYGLNTELKTRDKTYPLLLLDAKLTDINGILNILRQYLTENDSLLIYYAGHGQYLGANKEAYWIPKDGERDNPFTWFSAHTLIATMKLINARSILVVSDSCFSGAMSREPPDLAAFGPERRQSLLKQGSRKSRVFISSGGTEPVLDEGCKDGQHSIFACAFLSALEQPEYPIFSSGELHHMQLLPKVGGRTKQQPQRKEIADSDHDNGDFIFARIEAQEKGRQFEAEASRTK